MNSLPVELVRQIRLVAFDFDGVFTDNAVYVFQDGMEAVRCHRGDGIGLRRLERAGIKPIIISTETNPVVSVRARKLKIEAVQGCEDKRAALDEILERMHLNYAHAAFMGNDVNDAECLQAVALPIVVADAHPDVVPLALYQTRQRGGEGAVREVCDLMAQILAHQEPLAANRF